MTNASAILAALGRSATLARTGEPDRAVRIVLRDGDQSVKMARGRLVGSEVTGAVSATDGVLRGDRLGVSGAVYEVEEAEDSYTPGLVDLRLRRRSGAAVVSAIPGYAAGILSALGQPITLPGTVTVRAQITRGAEHLTSDQWGAQVSVVRTVAAIAEADAVGLLRGEAVVLSGQTLRVADMQRDGRGLVRLVLE